MTAEHRAEQERQCGLPLTQPLDVCPATGWVEADEMLRIAADRIGPLGAWDEVIRAWLAAEDSGTVATVASWLARAWEQGRLAGRRELLDEAGTRPGRDRAPDAVLAKYARLVSEYASTDRAMAAVVMVLADSTPADADIGAAVRELVAAHRQYQRAQEEALARLVGDLATAQQAWVGPDLAMEADDTTGGAR